MGKSVAEQIMAEHLVTGDLVPGAEVALKIDQTLTQDVTGTLAYLEFEAMGVERARPAVAVSYVDHNLLQTDFRNADDHRYLRTHRGALWPLFLAAGNGICHQVHLERFSAPGKDPLGLGQPHPHRRGRRHAGLRRRRHGRRPGPGRPALLPGHARGPGDHPHRALPGLGVGQGRHPGVLRRLTVKGGYGKILEYFGPALAHLCVPERATITNMGAELGATTSIFPSDARPAGSWPCKAGRRTGAPSRSRGGPIMPRIEEVDLAELEPLIACPSSPDRVVPVRELEGTPVEQVLIGSCANSSLRDLMVVSKALKGRQVHPRVSLEINPGSRQVLENLALAGGLLPLLEAGARLMPPGCWGCIGMGQAPASHAVSVRTFPRNFPGRSGTKDDQVYLASPETAGPRPFSGRWPTPAAWVRRPASPSPLLPGERPLSGGAAPCRHPGGGGARPQHRALPATVALAGELAGKGMAEGGR